MFWKYAANLQENTLAKQQLYWNHTSARVFSCKFAAYFQSTFCQEHLWMAASGHNDYVLPSCEKGISKTRKECYHFIILDYFVNKHDLLFYRLFYQMEVSWSQKTIMALSSIHQPSCLESKTTLCKIIGFSFFLSLFCLFLFLN